MKLPLFSGPLKELNPLREELDALEEKMGLQFRQRERRFTLASISDSSRLVILVFNGERRNNLFKERFTCSSS